jgi:hypothetical protein
MVDGVATEQTNDFKDILLDGETRLWSGRPAWSHAKSGLGRARGRIGAGLFASVMFAAAVFAFSIGAAGAAVAALVIGMFALLALLNNQPDSDRDRDKHYLATDRRLIVLRDNPSERFSVALRTVTGIQVRSNANVHDITLKTGNGELDFLTLHALEDAQDVEKRFVAMMAKD